MSKVRTQIQLEPSEYELLKQRARRRGVSMSQFIREAVRRALGLEQDADDELRRRFLRAGGIGREPDERRDVARQHDELLYGP